MILRESSPTVRAALRNGLGSPPGLQEPEGKGIVNSVASIESVKMMLDHLGEEEAVRNIE